MSGTVIRVLGAGGAVVAVEVRSLRSAPLAIGDVVVLGVDATADPIDSIRVPRVPDVVLALLVVLLDHLLTR